MNEKDKKVEKLSEHVSSGNAKKDDVVIHKVDDSATVFKEKEKKEEKKKSTINTSKSKKTSKNSNSRLCFLIIFSFVMGGIVMIALLKWTPILNYASGTSNIIDNTKKTKVYEKSSLGTSISKVYDSVVMVESYKGEEEYSTGTGFVYKTDDKYGYVMTNQHVVSGCDKVVLVLSNDEEVEAKIVGGDEYLDIAIMTIDKSKVLQVATIGNSDDMNIGDTVFTVGSPMGYEYRGTVTSGILSGKDRMVSVNVSNSSSNDWVMKVLQIDAAINPGNSGGPLVNINGEVIGVNSMKLVEDEIEGMGFAIPIEMAMSEVELLEKGEKIERPVIGVELIDATSTYSLYLYKINLDSNVKSGAVVVGVEDGYPAAKAGLKKGDVIVKIDDTEIEDTSHLRYVLYKYSVGDEIKLKVIRDNKEIDVTLKLEKNA